jgi:hypothetical protein
MANWDVVTHQRNVPPPPQAGSCYQPYRLMPGHRSAEGSSAWVVILLLRISGRG